MACFFDVKILDVKPLAVYRGKTHTQEVLLELSNGKKISLFDPNCVIKKAAKGTKSKVSASFLSEKITKNDSSEYSVEQKPPQHASIRGKIIYLTAKKEEGRQKYYLGIIDAGVAFFSFTISALNNLKKGDFVKVNGSGNRVNIMKTKNR